MRKFIAATMVLLLIIPVIFIFFTDTKAASSQEPFTPHEVNVLVVSPADVQYSGGHYLVADLARYGFNVTHHASDNATATDYLTEPKTSNLSQYKAVVLQGIHGFPPEAVSAEEVTHFTNYNGILVVIGNALLLNETSDTFWGLDSQPIRTVEQRLGVDFTGFLGLGGAWHSNGTFELMDSSIQGLPSSLSYETQHPTAINYQMDLSAATNRTREVYDFTITSSSSPSLIGRRTAGITYYKGDNDAVGIYVQGAYIYGAGSKPTAISYFGLTDITERSSLLASLIAYALGRDIYTVIKPQPLANVRLDGVGQYYYSETEEYLNASLSNFDAVLDQYNISPTIGLIDFLDFKRDYWQIDAPKTLTQLKSRYRDWELSTNLRYYTRPTNMTIEQVASLIDSIKGNYSKLGIDLFSTVIAPEGSWSQSTLDAMTNKELYLLDILNSDYSDWWNLRLNSSIIVHSGTLMLPERVWNTSTLRLDPAQDFTQPNLDRDTINYRYFSQRGELALAVLNGFPSFVYYVPNFRLNEVGTFSLQMVLENLMQEIPDIRFVPLMEAGLYFGNKWIRFGSVSRTGSVIEFDVDASAIPEVVNIGKGMLWLRINANESIQEVSIDNNPWFYFDEHSIRMPTPEATAHVRLTLGAAVGPRVIESRYKVLIADYDGYRFNVSIASAKSLNVSVSMFLPSIGPFLNDTWSIYCLEPRSRWNYKFDSQNRMFKLWAISDGFVSFKVGVFWIVSHTPPRYYSNVTVSANFSKLEIDIAEVILSYTTGDTWTNVTMVPEGELYVAAIPAMPYGTVVNYRLFAYAKIDRWFVTETYSYKVIDDKPPEIDVPVWDPQTPLSGQPVNVRVLVSESSDASGVREVTLFYYLGTDITAPFRAKPVEMRNENGTWVAEIPGQGGGSTVTFYVVASDEVKNQEITSDYTYTVSILPIQPLLLILIVGVIAAVGITVLFYLIRVRKIKPRLRLRKQRNLS